MKLPFLIYGVLILAFLACGRSSETDNGIPVIHLDPSQEDTLNMSEYFGKVDLVVFNSMYSIKNFQEFGDKYLGVFDLGSTFNAYKQEFHVHDQEGNELYKIGEFGRGPGEYLMAQNELQIGKDTTLCIIDHSKYLVYSSDNKLLYNVSLKINQSGLRYLWQDSLIAIYSWEGVPNDQAGRDKARKIAEHTYVLDIYSIAQQKVIQSFFPMKEITGLVCNNHIYDYKDTLCLYHDKDSRIYEIHPDYTKVRYIVDKGKYDALLSQKESHESSGKGVSYARIDIYKCNETRKYVIGWYYFKRKHYHFLYDKQTGITRNFKEINNDLLGLPLNEGLINLDWMSGYRFKQDYLCGRYYEFVQKMEELKAHLGSEGWRLFGQNHPDFVRLYEKELKKIENDDDDYYSTKIFWRYYFK